MLRIEYERRKRGWSQRRLAASAGRAQSVISLIEETGVASEDTLEAIADALQISPAHILLREVKVMPEPDEVTQA